MTLCYIVRLTNTVTNIIFSYFLFSPQQTF